MSCRVSGGYPVGQVVGVGLNAVSTGSPYFTQGRVWSAKHGGYRAFQARGIPIRNDQDEIEGWLGTLIDIQDSIDIDLLLQRTQEDLANSLTALRDSEARQSVELSTMKAHEQNSKTQSKAGRAGHGTGNADGDLQKSTPTGQPKGLHGGPQGNGLRPTRRANPAASRQAKKDD